MSEFRNTLFPSSIWVFYARMSRSHKSEDRKQVNFVLFLSYLDFKHLQHFTCLHGYKDLIRSRESWNALEANLNTERFLATKHVTLLYKSMSKWLLLWKVGPEDKTASEWKYIGLGMKSFSTFLIKTGGLASLIAQLKKKDIVHKSRRIDLAR